MITHTNNKTNNNSKGLEDRTVKSIINRIDSKENKEERNLDKKSNLKKTILKRTCSKQIRK
jgi:hypothetical protein